MTVKKIYICLTIFATLFYSPVNAGMVDRCAQLLGAVQSNKTKIAMVIATPFRWVLNASERLMDRIYPMGLNLKTYLKVFPKANDLAKELGIDPKSFSHLDGELQISEFLALAGRILNKQGRPPLELLKELSSSTPKITDLVRDLEAAAKFKGRVVVWQDKPRLASELSQDGMIRITVGGLLTEATVTYLGLAIKHELGHSSIDFEFSGRRMSPEDFLERNLDNYLKDEVAARLAEEPVYSFLRTNGFDVSNKNVEQLSLQIWKAKRNGASESELVDLVKPNYELDLMSGLLGEWAKLYQQADSVEVRRAFETNSEAEIMQAVQRIFSSSLRWSRLRDDQRTLYEKTILVEVHKQFNEEGKGQKEKSVERVAFDRNILFLAE